MSAPFTLDEAITLASATHAGQTDKADSPDIEPAITVDDLRATGCPEPAITAVRALTKNLGEPLEQAMARAATDPIARVVKHADNGDPERLALLESATARRLRRKHADGIRLLDQSAGPMPGTAHGH